MPGHSGKAWREGRKRTLQRDNHQCQDCGSTENIHVHHIKRPEEFNDPDAAHHPSNLVALCKYCHGSWEGIEARPILLDNHGTNLGPLVEDLVVDHITRLSHRISADLIYPYFLAQNKDACWFCYRPDGGYSSEPAEKWRTCIRLAVKVGFGDIEDVKIPIPRDGLGRPVERSSSPYWLCDGCLGVRERNMAIKVGEYIKTCFWASEALAAQGVLHDPGHLADVGRELKENPKRSGDDMGIMVEAVAKSVRAVEGDDRLPDWLLEERY